MRLGMAEAAEPKLSLVPDRSCGTCVTCCYVPQIDEPELRKPAGTVCEHCTGKGCGIYESRPPPCRTFHCGWRYTADLNEDWRPDKSGVLIVGRSDIPGEPEARTGWQFNVLAGEVAVRRNG